MSINTTLIKLNDCKNENKDISDFYTEQPSEILKMYFFCKNNDIPIRYKSIDDDEIVGNIEDIDVYFGGNENLQCIEIWINKW